MLISQEPFTQDLLELLDEGLLRLKKTYQRADDVVVFRSLVF